MRVYRALLLLAAFAFPSSAEQFSLDLKTESVKVAWTLGDVLHTVRGTFALKSGRINLDSASGVATGRIVVDLTSGVSGNSTRDRKMHTYVLESGTYPEAIFLPDRYEGQVAIPGESMVKLHGMLQIHGATHALTMEVQTKATADRMDAVISFDIPYVAWGMKDPSNFLLKVSKSVRVSIDCAGMVLRR